MIQITVKSFILVDMNFHGYPIRDMFMDLLLNLCTQFSWPKQPTIISVTHYIMILHYFYLFIHIENSFYTTEVNLFCYKFFEIVYSCFRSPCV